MTLDISTDYEVVDNLETVTYYQKTSETGYGDAITVENVLRRAIGRDFKTPMMQHTMTTFHIWAANVSFTPALNDKLVDSHSVAWTVKEVGTESVGTRYRLKCLKAVV
jgi:hypothetical protein